MTEPTYVKDLFEENFINEWIDFIFNYSITDYAPRIAEAIKTSMNFAEEVQKSPQDEDAVNNQIYSINTLLEIKKLSFSKYKSFIPNLPILMPIAIKQFQLQYLINNEFNCLWQSDYVNCQVNIKPMLRDFIKGAFNAMRDSESTYYQDLAKNVPSLRDAVENTSISPFVQFGILYDFLDTSIKTVNQIDTNFLDNAETLMHCYFDYEAYYLQHKEDVSIKNFITKEMGNFLNENIMLRNLERMHGGREKVSDEEKELLFKLKKTYDDALITLRKVRFLKQNTLHENICKKQVLYNLGNTSFQNIVHYNELKQDVEIIFSCQSNLDTKTCKYKKGKICSMPKKHEAWKALKYIKKENHGLWLYLSSYQRIKTEKEFDLLLNHYTIGELSLMSAKQILLDDIDLITTKLEPYEKLIKKTNATLFKDFSNIKNIEIENKTEHTEEISLLKSIFDKSYYYFFVPEVKDKKEINQLLKQLKKIK